MAKPYLAGVMNGRARLTPDDVRLIRALWHNGARQVDLADQFGVGQSQISRIVRGEQWMSGGER